MFGAKGSDAAFYTALGSLTEQAVTQTLAQSNDERDEGKEAPSSRSSFDTLMDGLITPRRFSW